MDDRGDDLHRHHLQLPRPPVAFDPQADDQSGLRHERRRLCLHRQHLPDMLRRHVSHIGHPGRPVRPEKGDVSGHPGMVGGLHRRRPFDQYGTVRIFPRAAGAGRAHDLRRADRRRDRLVRKTPACHGQQPLYGGRFDRHGRGPDRHRMALDDLSVERRLRPGRGHRHPDRHRLDGRLRRPAQRDTRRHAQRKRRQPAPRQSLHVGRALEDTHAVGRAAHPFCQRSGLVFLSLLAARLPAGGFGTDAHTGGMGRLDPVPVRRRGRRIDLGMVGQNGTQGHGSSARAQAHDDAGGRRGTPVHLHALFQRPAAVLERRGHHRLVQPDRHHVPELALHDLRGDRRGIPRTQRSQRSRHHGRLRGRGRSDLQLLRRATAEHHGTVAFPRNGRPALDRCRDTLENDTPEIPQEKQAVQK